jgi:arginine/lysine/ornithine decarboxylase
MVRNMDQQKTPLYSALVQHYQHYLESFHVPGHKFGAIFSPKGLTFFRDILKLDATEITGLDDLHAPESVIAESQSLTAALYGVNHSFFLVNGSTVGNLAMILSVCGEDDLVLVQRNSHKSIINGLMLAGAKAVYLSPEYDPEVRVPAHVSKDTIISALEQYPQTKALILTNPNYYGMSVDLTEVIKEAHRCGVPVLVDEAHGAHFTLGSPFPKSAVECGADVVVHSAHKTLPAMTMGSFLHVNSNLVSLEKIRYYLQVLQSSSPSYPIMASLDLARHYLARIKHEGIHEITEQIHQFINGLNEIPQIEVVYSKHPEITTDLLKVTVQTRCSLSGFELRQRFEKYGIFPEMADTHNVVLVLPLAKDFHLDKPLEKIKESLEDVKCEGYNLPDIPDRPYGKIAEEPISYRDLKTFSQKVVPFHEAVGYKAASMVIPYPPGIPLLMKGETIMKEHIVYIQQLIECGARFQGSSFIFEKHLEIYT